MSLYQLSVVQMSTTLRNLQGILAKAVAHAEANEFPADNLVGLRLTPDMHSLPFQIQAACDTAKGAAARLTGTEAPSFEDNETTMAELDARITKTLEYLDTVEEKQFEGAAERDVVMPFFPPGKATKGALYLREMALPNFYFHVTIAYSLLRSNGVKVGKRDFITMLTFHDLG